MESKLTAFKLADTVIERAVRRGLAADCTKIDPYTARRNLRTKSKYHYLLTLKVYSRCPGVDSASLGGEARGCRYSVHVD